MNLEHLNALTPPGVVAVPDPDDVATLNLFANGQDIGAITVVHTGWLACGPEDSDGTRPVYGIFANVHTAASACRENAGL